MLDYCFVKYPSLPSVWSKGSRYLNAGLALGRVKEFRKLTSDLLKYDSENAFRDLIESEFGTVRLKSWTGKKSFEFDDQITLSLLFIKGNETLLTWIFDMEIRF